MREVVVIIFSILGSVSAVGVDGEEKKYSGRGWFFLLGDLFVLGEFIIIL